MIFRIGLFQATSKTPGIGGDSKVMNIELLNNGSET